MNNQRRIFRGRGGPNDRRLPKHNARRRKPNHGSQDIKRTVPKYNDSPATYMLRNGDEEMEDLSQQQNESEELLTQGFNDNTVESAQNDHNNQQQDKTDACLQKEIQHLRRRIRNVQESIQTSTSLANVSVYQEICLNAVSNCVNEWRSIARHYSSSSEEQDLATESAITPELRKEMGLAVFHLIQLSVQSGPLTGAKPGYFKRCGGAVAKVVQQYLEGIVPSQNHTLADMMGFSSKQVDAMEKWIINAQKAAENNKEPSKSVLKQQQKQQQQQHTRKKWG